MTDEDRYMKLQQDVLGATKAAIELNAVGLPVGLLATYVRQVGGDIVMVADDGERPEGNPFRIHITTEVRPKIESATETLVVKEVLGWG